MRLGRALLKIGPTIRFLGIFLVQLVAANALVTWEVLTPRHYMRPGIIRVPIRSRTDLEVTLLANLISLTPGTISLEVAEDRRALFVHGLHVLSPDHFRVRIRTMEDRLLRVLR